MLAAGQSGILAGLLVQHQGLGGVDLEEGAR
ncbi:MAG: hypothetical protein DDT35_00532 [Firmicutes bacterium]|nr:hypothetical protein [Bacillota bacterium]